MASEIICIGFNCRPIAQKVSEAGYRPIVIDYFGDLDIHPCAAEGHYFLEESSDPKDAEHFKAWALATLDRLARSRGGKKPLILPGSGFDDEPEAWAKFTSLGRVLGSSPEAIKRARNLNTIADLLWETPSTIIVPKTRHVTIDAATEPTTMSREIHGELSFPVVAKRTRTAGGAGIEFVQKTTSLEEVFRRVKEDLQGKAGTSVSFNIQEFVGGAEARDASVLAINGRVVCKTLQVIGDAALHAPKRFSYCGNTIPFDTGDPSLDHSIDLLVAMLHRDFGLDGLYGLDMVLAKGKGYLVEVNPRVPGSTELASVSVGRNLIADHVASFLAPGSLPGTYTPARHAIKRILFAGKDFTMPALDTLGIHGKLHDITPPGTQVSRGMPVVTYMHHGPLDAAGSIDVAARQDIKAIYAFLERDRP
ncbi:MAG: ATP-grasp domain-containing protein [Candidatus Sigynarchaeum springense]